MNCHHNGELRTKLVTNDDTASSEKMKRERLTITFAKGQRKRLKEIAEKKRTSINTVIRWALDDYIDGSASNSVERPRPKGAPKAG